MIADSRLSRAVPFPLAGPDFVIRFTTKDLIDIAEKFEDETGEWVSHIERRLRAADAVVVRKALEVGLKGPGGFTRPKGIEYDDLPFGPDQAVRPISDALMCAITGKAYADVVAEREARAEGLREMLSDAPATAAAAE